MHKRLRPAFFCGDQLHDNKAGIGQFLTYTNQNLHFMKSINLIAGFGGAVVLTLLNETLKEIDEKMPRIDLLGEEALAKASAFLGSEIKNENALFKASLAGDLLSNTAYFSLISGTKNEIWTKAASAGFLAGIAAVSLPKELGLDDKPVTKTLTTKVLTVGYYMMGAFATAGILSLIQKK